MNNEILKAECSIVSEGTSKAVFIMKDQLPKEAKNVKK